MKKFFKTLGWILLLALVAIQFFHPKKNIHEGEQANTIAKQHAIPDDVKVIMKKACNDCHTNNTVYPWYSKIQPVHWWLNNHILEGKGHLNFDEYSDKRLRYQYHKLEEVIEQVKEGEMPLKSYTWTHKDAILTDEEKNKLIAWAEGAIKNMEAQYPIDSLKRPRPQQ
jgi:hypothetical protein